MRKNVNFDGIQNQIDWLENTLSMMSEDENLIWKIVVIHQGVFSVGRAHGEIKHLQEVILPILVKYKVDMIISGHDHSVQYLRMDMNMYNTLQNDENFIIPDPVRDFDKKQCSKKEVFSCQIGRDKILKKTKTKGKKNMAKEEMVLRESVVSQHEYLNQFIFGNGGIQRQQMCPLKQNHSLGKLSYGNAIMGIGDVKINEDKIEVKMLSTKNELLYTVKILRTLEDSI